jgi:hypothetical protein
MSENDALYLAQEFLARMGSGAEPAGIASCFNENMEWEIAGGIGVLPWIGKNPVGSPLSISSMIPAR